MRIGVDIDGVLTDMERFITDYGTKFCYENKLEYKIDISKYDDKIMGFRENNDFKFWNTYLLNYAKSYPTRDFSKEVIKKLREDNHEIYIITSRDEYGLPEEAQGTMKQIVIKWLKDKEIEYDKLIFTNKRKLSYCVENKVDVMIEDAPENILEISSKIPVFCFDCPYNSMINGNNITRVYSWYDVLNKIEKM